MATNWLNKPLSLKDLRIWVAGHGGMVGAAMVARLEREDCQILTVSHADLDLCNQGAVDDWMAQNKPDIIVVAAAKVGGIGANAANPAGFFYDNMMISANIIHCAHKYETKRLLFLGSSCIYPRECAQPIDENALLSGALEPTNEAYALAKIGGMKMASYYRAQYGCDFISAMPCNLYGVGDSYDESASHVIPALIMKAHRAKVEGRDELVVWGSGAPLREFMYVDDLAEALVFLLQSYNGAQHINVGSGAEISIKDLAANICEVVGYKGKIAFDTSKPDGTPQKIMDVSRLSNAGWRANTALKSGLKECYQDFMRRCCNA